jgi:hypothetical protein
LRNVIDQFALVWHYAWIIMFGIIICIPLFMNIMWFTWFFWQNYYLVQISMPVATYGHFPSFHKVPRNYLRSFIFIQYKDTVWHRCSRKFVSQHEFVSNQHLHWMPSGPSGAVDHVLHWKHLNPSNWYLPPVKVLWLIYRAKKWLKQANCVTVKARAWAHCFLVCVICPRRGKMHLSSKIPKEIEDVQQDRYSIMQHLSWSTRECDSCSK